jgi:enhancing lycopene biosynthesis protein 2
MRYLRRTGQRYTNAKKQAGQPIAYFCTAPDIICTINNKITKITIEAMDFLQELNQIFAILFAACLLILLLLRCISAGA